MKPQPSPKKTYDAKWRDAVRKGAIASADALAPALLDHLDDVDVKPSSWVDVGAGECHLGAALLRANPTMAVTNYDGPWASEVARVPGAGAFWTLEFDAATLSVMPPHTADAASCLEVAEHVEEKLAPMFVRWLKQIAPVIVFSAAIPGQGGEGHVNEQWPAHWIDLFIRHPGDQPDRDPCSNSGPAWDYVSPVLRDQLWADERVEPWYRQNLLVFHARRPRDSNGFVMLNDGTAENHIQRARRPIVHPGVWSWHTGAASPFTDQET